MSSKFKEFLKEASMQVGAGGSAGFVEVCIMHPLDLVKTRLQLQNKITVNTTTGQHVSYHFKINYSINRSFCLK
jgi:solute carrier family 25 (mitochondrial 2-oxodicarboxylate transporter), member 21